MSQRLVLYFFQGERGEDMRSPNAFVLRSQANPARGHTFGDFLAQFPPLLVAKQQQKKQQQQQQSAPAMHFRFRVADPKFEYVWQDMDARRDAGAVLPEFDGVVMCRVLRMDRAVRNVRRSRLRRKVTPRLPKGMMRAAADAAIENDVQHAQRQRQRQKQQQRQQHQEQEQQQRQKQALRQQQQPQQQQQTSSRHRDTNGRSHHSHSSSAGSGGSGDDRRPGSRGSGRRSPQPHVVPGTAGSSAAAGVDGSDASQGSRAERSRSPRRVTAPELSEAGRAAAHRSAPVSPRRERDVDEDGVVGDGGARENMGHDDDGGGGGDAGNGTGAAGQRRASLHGPVTGGDTTAPPAKAAIVEPENLEEFLSGGSKAAEETMIDFAPMPQSSAAPGSAADPVGNLLDSFEESDGGSAPGGGSAPAPARKRRDPRSGPARPAGAMSLAATDEDGEDLDGVSPAQAYSQHKIVGVRLNGTANKAGKSAAVVAAMEERERQAAERTEAALAFKRRMDAREQAENEAFDAARQRLGPGLTQWAEEAGKKRNVRALLSSLHTVLWEGARWREVSIGDLLEASRVKLYYRKAMLVVHPDKNQRLSPEQRFIAKRIFEAINESYDDFERTETP